MGMRRAYYSYSQTSLPAASLGSPKTLVQMLAATNGGFRILAIDFVPQGSTGTTLPMMFDLALQSDAGTPGSAPTAAKWVPLAAYAGSLVTTLAINHSAEPTLSQALPRWGCHQQAPSRWTPPFELRIDSGGRLAVRYLSSYTVGLEMTIYFEE